MAIEIPYAGERPSGSSRLFAIPPSLAGVPWRPRGMAHLYSANFVVPGAFSFFVVPLWRLSGVPQGPAAIVIRSLSRGCRDRRIFRSVGTQVSSVTATKLDSDVLMRTDLETYLSENCLVKTDRASMLASLEVRVPYLDEIVLDRILPFLRATRLSMANLRRSFCLSQDVYCQRGLGSTETRL